MKAHEYKKAIEKVMKDPASYGIRECTLCGREAISFVGVCFPDTGSELQKALNEPSGKRRSVLYGVCSECAENGLTEEISRRIDDEILKSIQKGEQMGHIE